MESVAHKIIQSPKPTIIDGVPHRYCGEGRKQRRANAEECGRPFPLTAKYWTANAVYSDGFGITCLECKEKQNARYAERVNTAIVPIRVYTDVPIGHDGLCRGVSILVDGVETPHLVVAEACRYWGLDSTAQLRRIQEDDTLSAGLSAVKMAGESGAIRPIYALRYNLVPLWLSGVETAKMRKAARRDQLAAYQKVCGQVLSDYFFGTKTAPLPLAQRIQSETAVISTPDTHVMAYLDSALSKAFGPIYQAVSLLPGMDETTRKTFAAVLGATRIEIEIPAPVINGDVYFGTLNSRLMIPALQCGEAGDWELVPNLINLLMTDWVCFIFGESSEMAKRMKKHAGKNRIGRTTPARQSITSDDPKKLETLFRDRKPGGVIAVPNTKDLLVVRKSVLPSLATLPNHMPISEAKERLRVGWLWEI